MAPASRSREILLDLRCLQGPSAKRGIGTYARGLTQALSGLSFEYSVLLDAELGEVELPKTVSTVHRVRRRSHGRLASYEDAVALAADLDRIRPALYHALTPTLPSRSPCPVAVTVHDMIPWAFGGWRMFGERVRNRVARRLIPKAELIFAVSNSTRDDLLRIGGADESRIRVVYEGVGPEFKPQADAAARVQRRWSLEGPYLLFVGALDVRKDPHGLIRAWRTVTASGISAQLVLAGDPGPQAPADMGGALRLGHVSTEELVDLLGAAGCLLYPSLYEGFGLPALEAMACGCPVVAYRNSSLPEVMGGAGILVPNLDSDALGRAAVELLSDPARRSALVKVGLRQASQFTWARAARGTIDGYRAIVDIISAA